MYDFIDISEQQHSAALPSVAMHFKDYFIEDEIEGYRTLTVSGREMIGIELDTQSVKNGTITLDRRLPGRELVIRYRLTAESNNQFQKKFQLLRAMLHTTEKVEVYFADEPDMFYKVELSGVDEVPSDKNTIVSSFTLQSDSPFKFGEPRTTNGIVSVSTPYPTPTEEIKVVTNGSTSVITITNGVQEIRLDGNFAANDEVVINTQKGTVKRGDEDITYTVALNSDFENFTVEQGQVVSSPQGTIELTCREWWL